VTTVRWAEEKEEETRRPEDEKEKRQKSDQKRRKRGRSYKKKRILNYHYVLSIPKLLLI
jgi:hypothetical protein